MNLTQIDLNLLVALDALLKERNVTRAGRRVGLSQPAMSSALSRLRALFDDPLLERVGREYRLSPCAIALGGPLQTALSAIERTLQRDEAFDPVTARRRFKVAASDYVLFVLCPEINGHIHRIAPNVHLDFLQVGPHSAAQLEARQIDLSIQPALLMRGFSEQVLFEDPWVCAVWKHHDTVKTRITLEQLGALEHATFYSGRYSIADRFVGPVISTPLQVGLTSQSFTALPFMVTGTQQVALLQRSLGLRVRDLAELRLLEPPVPLATLKIAMTWNPLFTADPAHSWLRDSIAEVCRAASARVDATPLS